MPAAQPAPQEEFLVSDRFLVEIDGVPLHGFHSVVIADSEADVVEYREGADPPAQTHKLPGQIRYSSVRLVRGVSQAHHELYDWWHSVVTGPVQRRSVVIIALDAGGQPAVRWHVLRAWPRLYRVSPFDAVSDTILCETLELACEGVERA